MDTKKRSTFTFYILLAILAGAIILNSYLPQGTTVAQMPQSTIPKWQLALGGAGITTVSYGLLGFLGLVLWRKLGFPEIWEEKVTDRQRFFFPMLAGLGCGVLLILLDMLFSRFNGIGRLMHPPFPTSLVASLSAGIGEEMLFRLFFISFWTWLVGKVILRGRGLSVVYWAFSTLSACVFAASHVPSLMFLLGLESMAQFPPVLLVEAFIMNGLISLTAAYYFRKYGFLAPAGVHFWNDILWHTLWGLV